MSDTFWLRCDACNKKLVESQIGMQLCLRFKPSLIRRRIPEQPNEHCYTCSGCGWVNVFVPAPMRSVLLTDSWRNSIVTK